MKKTILICLALVCCLFLAGCGWRPYKVPIQQGNILDQSKISQLRSGMTREDVRALLGDPVLVNVFDQDTWSYVYTLQTKSNKTTKKFLILYFKYNTLVSTQSRDIK